MAVGEGSLMSVEDVGSLTSPWDQSRELSVDDDQSNVEHSICGSMST